MKSLVLVHGSGSGPWVFDGWETAFPEYEIVTVDLQEGLDVPAARLADYAAAIERAAAAVPRPLAVCAWSLGGLAAMVAAERVRPDALVLLGPSPPVEIQGPRDVTPTPGTFDPEETGARFPAGIRARRESTLAMGERDRGVSVPTLPGRTLVVFGDMYREERGPTFAAFYGADALDAGAATHWDLVLDPRVRSQIARWLSLAGEESVTVCP